MVELDVFVSSYQVAFKAHFSIKCKALLSVLPSVCTHWKKVGGEVRVEGSPLLEGKRG